MSKKILTGLAVLTLVAGLFPSIPSAQAAVNIIPASGGQDLPAGSGFVDLSNIIINEAAPGEIKLGTHTISLPAGWEFDLNSFVILETNSGALSFASDTIAPSASAFSFTINSESFTAPADMLIRGLRVRPTGTAGGYITQTVGTIVGVTNGVTSLGALSVQGGETPPPATGGGGTSTLSGGGGAIYPAPPTDGTITINNGEAETNSREVTLRLSANNVGDMIIANDAADFSGSILEPFREVKQWTLSEGAGEKKVFVKYRSRTGLYSEPVSDTIILTGTTTPADDDDDGNGGQTTGLYADVNGDGLVNIVDAVLIVSRNGESNGREDVNGDGRVNILDFNEVMEHWTGLLGKEGRVSDLKTARFTLGFPISLKVGQSVILPVAINSPDNTIYTGRLVLDYPAHLLAVTKIELISGYVPFINGAENDRQVAGSFIKTAGWPGGFLGNQAFVNVTFQAKAAGQGQVAVNAGSVLMDKNGHNKFAGGASVPVTVMAAVVSAPPKASEPEQSEVTVPEVDVNDSTTTVESDGRESLLAAAFIFLTSWPGYLWLFLILLLILLGVILRHWYVLARQEEEEEQKRSAGTVVRQNYQDYPRQ